MTRSDFFARWSPHTPQPYVRAIEWPADLFACFCALPPGRAVLLESLAGPTDICRYSILGLVDGPPVTLPTPTSPTDPQTQTLKDILSSLPGPLSEPLPEPYTHLPFVGGWMGYFGYPLARALEHLPTALPASSVSSSLSAALPAGQLLSVPAALICDHHSSQAFLVACVEPQADANTAWSLTLQHIESLESWLTLTSESPATLPHEFALTSALSSPFDAHSYQQCVRDAIDYIEAGDIFQVNLSQCFTASCTGDARALYARLRRASPAPFAGYFDTGTVQLLSSSPERFLSARGLEVETRPIKGTLRRGTSEAEDALLEQRLRQDVKENSEHVMIVDMARNDLGKIADADAVSVEGLLRVEAYPQVLHLVSTVKARLERPHTLWEMLEATFPGASITGAPKVRAMELIEALERSPRGPYTGALGYISRCGGLDLAMTIRTLVIHNQTLHMQVGGGIVARSSPPREYEETLLKAKGMMKALAL